MCPTMMVSLLKNNSNYGGCNQGKQCFKRCVFRRLRKTDSDVADVTCCGRLFQRQAAVTGKARSPIVDNCVRPTVTMATDFSSWSGDPIVVLSRVVIPDGVFPFPGIREWTF